MAQEINSKNVIKATIKAIVTLMKDNGYADGRRIRLPLDNKFYQGTNNRTFKLIDNKLFYYNSPNEKWYEVSSDNFVSLDIYVEIMNGIYETIKSHKEED